MSDKIDGWERKEHAFVRDTAGAYETLSFEDNVLGIGVIAGRHEHLSTVKLPVLRALLAENGLHIVGEAEKRVLDEMAIAEITKSCNRGIECCPTMPRQRVAYVCKAELSRRAAQKGGGS